MPVSSVQGIQARSPPLGILEDDGIPVMDISMAGIF